MVIAEFNGRCVVCDLPIYEGQEIVKVESEWVHKECSEDLLDGEEFRYE